MNESNKKYWLKSGSYTLLLNIQQLLFGFGSFYLLVRMLDKHSFGIWTLFLATTGIFEMARTGLIQYALIKFLSESPAEEKPKIVSASFVLSGILLAICIVVNFAIAGYLSRLWNYPGLVQMLFVFNLTYILQTILAEFQWIEQAHLKFRGILITTMMRQGGFFVFVFISFILHSKISLTELVYMQAMATGAAAITEFFFIRGFLQVSYKIHWIWVRKLFGYGKFVFGTHLSSVLSGSISQMMLGTILSPAAAGSYNVAIRIVSLTDIPTNALSAIVFPQSAKRFAMQGADAGKYLYEKSVGTLIAILIPLVLFVFIFPEFVVHLVAGVNYSDTVPMVKIVILTCLFSPFDRFFGVIMDSIGRAKLNFMIISSFISLTLILNYVLIKKIGIMGVIYGTLTADMIVFFLRQFLLYRILVVNPLSPFIYAWRFYPEFIRHYLRPLMGKKSS